MTKLKSWYNPILGKYTPKEFEKWFCRKPRPDKDWKVVYKSLGGKLAKVEKETKEDE